MRFTHFYLVLLGFSVMAAGPEQSSLKLTLELARERAYRADQVDWKTVEKKARVLVSKQGEEAAIRYVLKSLGDGHSFYRPPGKNVTNSNVSKFNVANLNFATKLPPRVLSEVRESIEGVPVVRINSWVGNHQQAMAATKALRSNLVSTLSAPRCGVILDFSGNSGGNMWPMLVGLSPLFTEGILGYFKDAHGTSQTILKKSSRIFFGNSDHILNDATEEQPKHSARLIAVVVGSRSSSSGEIVPILFHGQQNVRIFGQQTSGQSTANTTFSLPNSGAAVITTAVTLDRNKKIFDAHIEPEYSTARPLEDAARWISDDCQHK